MENIFNQFLFQSSSLNQKRKAELLKKKTTEEEQNEEWAMTAAAGLHGAQLFHLESR